MHMFMTCPCGRAVSALDRLDSLSGRGSRLSLGMSAYQRIISNNCYAHDKQQVNPGQVRGFGSVLYKL